VTKKEEEIKVTIICWQCDRKFTILASEVKKKRVIYLDEEGEKLGSQLVMPKSYTVPCPYCQAENEVKLP